MSRTRKRWIILLISSMAPLSLAPLAVARDQVEIGTVEKIETSPWMTSLQQMRTQLVATKLRTSVSEWESVMVDSILQDWAAHLRVEPADFGGIATITQSGEDVMLARWRRTSGQALVRAISVWDATSLQYVFLECDPSILNSNVTAAKFLEGLFLWQTDRFASGPYVSLRGFIRPGRNEGAREFVLAAEMPPLLLANSSLNPPQIRIVGWFEETALILAITAPKNWHAYAEGTTGVAERFPPLKERIMDWSTGKMIRELGKGFDGIHHGTYPFERDQVLIRELVRREITPEEMRAIIAPAELWGAMLSSRVSAVIRVMSEERRIQQNKPVLREVLLSFVSRRNQNLAAESMFVSLIKENDINVSDIALDLVFQGHFGGSASTYLEQRGDSEVIYRRLEQIQVSSAEEAWKMEVLRRIRGRIRPGAERQVRIRSGPLR